jgi:hypothetical protein
VLAGCVVVREGFVKPADLLVTTLAEFSKGLTAFEEPSSHRWLL